MTSWNAVVAAVLVAALLGGPLASVAGAQQPAQPAQPPAPDLFQESMKPAPGAEENKGAYATAAVVTNVFLVPGRAITCALGGVVGIGVLAVTLGTGYRAASNVWHEGCGGKWMVTGDDLRPDSPSGRFYMDSMEQR